MITGVFASTLLTLIGIPLLYYIVMRHRVPDRAVQPERQAQRGHPGSDA